MRLEQLEDRTLPSSHTAATVADLIADINAANKAHGSNAITLTAPTTSPYVLTAVDNPMNGANGLPVIADHDTLTIVGNGDTIERSTASGTPAFRLFDAASGAALTLEYLTLQNGLAFGSGSAADGGAIYSEGILTLSGVTAQNNEALGSNGAPGTGTQVNGQAGQDATGGVLWSNGALTLQCGTTMENNLALGGNGGPASCNKKGGGTGGTGGSGYGGGLYVAGGTATISNITLSHNTAQEGQGGPAGCGSFAGHNGSSTAGGLDVAAANVTMSNATVEFNTADFAGGIYIQYNEGFNQATLTISGSTVSSNSATTNGGGIYNQGTLTISTSTISGNSAGSGGGGIFNGNDVTATLSGCTISGNSAGTGGGGGILNSSTLKLCNDTIQANIASGVVSGIVMVTGTVYIDSFTLNNTSNIGNIGGTLILQNC
jgi:predicted outer membrane repeat protein